MANSPINSKQENKIELLVMLIKSIDYDPMEELIKLCEPIVHDVTRRYFLNGFEYSDFKQEARRVLLEAIEDYEFGEDLKFGQFYKMMLSNHFNKLIRKEHTQKRKVNLKTSSLDELVEEAGPHVLGTSSVMSRPEEATLVKERFANYLVDLSTLERDVFFLFIQGYDYEEIVEKLGKSMAQIQTAIYRCSTKLKRHLN
jgi:RNA polymerase sigma factor (sigma-70 family)